ncbi:hypothetical protein QT327_16900 [Olivibacter sp. 47]|jgi:hypothetical protein|uniref:hypothetical protein n=1 Tax=Olivibacter sp. 47 TaxID=3056486 RepID=UPI0025A45501|nr:hypothetical protein [Olivibacter sp. 47]MDM8176007.1 hypothetical protein [Olivibacter sp. 47]
MEKSRDVLLNFLIAAKKDPFLGTVHIALYMAIFRKWIETGFDNPISIASKELMPDAKIQSSITYYRALKQLHESGYIRYVPSYKKKINSCLYIDV